MQVVILSGGFGTRLSHIVKDVPKPMAPINNVPFLDYIINTLKSNNIDKFVFLTGYKSEVIEEYYKNLKNAKFIKEENALGTGGALLNAFNCLEEEFFVINGDTFFDVDYNIFYDFAKNNSAAIALRYTDNIKRYGFVSIDDSFNITNFTEKSNLPDNTIDGYINGGIYYFKKSILEKYYKNFNGQFISLENEIFPQLVNNKELKGLPIGGLFIDIGIPEDYQKAQTLIPSWLKKIKKPALFIDKDGTIIVNTEYPHGNNFIIIENTLDIVKKYAQKDYYIIMVTNQAGIAKGKFNFEQMQEGFEGIKNYYKKSNLYFDDIEFCPYHKDGVIKEYAYDSLLRKPNPGMILAACEKHKIGLKNSVMIGDNHKIDNIKLPYLKCEIIEEEICL